MPSYPGAIYPTPTLADGVDTIQAAHPNALGAEINAIETQLGTNPKTIADNVTVGATPTDVADFLDMVATRLRQIIGDSAWTSSVPKSLTELVAEKLTAPEAPVAGDVMYYDGSNWKGLHVGSATQGYLLGLSAGLLPEWQGDAGRPYLSSPSGAAVGDLMRYDGSAWVRIPVGTTGQRLTVAAGVPVWASQDATGAITSPAVYIPSSRSWVLCATIQAAIDASAAGDYVVIPPGTWTGDIVCKANTPIVELVPGTVEIVGQVTLVDNCRICVWRVKTPALGSYASAIEVNCASGSGLAYVDVGELVLYTTVGSAGRYGLTVYQGTVNARIGRLVYDGNSGTNAYFVNVIAGTLNLVGLQPFVKVGASWLLMQQMACSGGTLNIHGGMLKDDSSATAILQSSTGVVNVYGLAYNKAQVSGKVNQLRGDRASRNYASAAFFNSAT